MQCLRRDFITGKSATNNKNNKNVPFRTVYDNPKTKICDISLESFK